MKTRAADLGLMCLLGTFAEHTVVSQASCVKVETDVPLDGRVPARLRRRHRLGFGRSRRRGPDR
jgi:hypothetical protein